MMKYRKLFVLFVATVAIIVAANHFTRSRAPQTKLEKALLFPELAGKINEVAWIEIRSGAQPPVILERQDDLWRLSSADRYPAQFDKIKNTVIGLSQLQVVDEKTSNPERYAILNVEDPDAEDANSVLLTLADHATTPLASLIVGKPRNTGGHRPALYVRKPDAASALLVEGELRVGKTNEDWYERDIINIPVTRIREVTLVNHTGHRLRVYREVEAETVFKLAEGETTAPSELLDKLATFLEDMRADGVRAKDNFEFVDNVITTVMLTTFDGLVVTIKNTVQEGQAFAHFSFTVDKKRADPAENKEAATSEDAMDSVDVEAERQRLSESLSNWVYQIPNFKYKILDIDITTVPE